MGAAPLEPGMPESASMPAQPCSTACATSSSHGSPAWTFSRTAPESAGRRSMPLVTTRMTVPGNPSSAMTRFEPPPSTSQSSPVAHVSSAAATSSSAVGGDSSSSAGPPTRNVVSSERSTAQARLTRTCALPSTVTPPKVTVRSIRATLVSVSRAPTVARMVTTAPSAASTSTGRVNRT